MRTVHACLLVSWTLLVAAPALAWAPPGLVSWGEESYRLGPGESTTITVTFAQVPVRRWVLLVESPGSASHVNVRRIHDGSLVYDQRGERRHEVPVPWGQGESLSAVVTAGRQGGVFQVSVWGPPADQYLRAYSYEVNRALEAFARGEVPGARNHLQAALRQDPQDEVARVLLLGLEADQVPSPVTAFDPATEPGPDDAAESARRVATARERAAALREVGRRYEAVEALQGVLQAGVPASSRGSVLVDLAHVLLDLGNVAQARAAWDQAVALELDVPGLEDLDRRLVAAERAINPE